MPWDYEPIKKSYSIKSLDTLSTEIKKPVLESKICGFCGYNFAEFIKTGFLGCSKCYDSFEKELENYINEFR